MFSRGGGSTTSGRRLRGFWRLLLLVVVVVYVLWVLFPFYWMLVTSLRPNREMYGGHVTLVPQQVILDHYRMEINNYKFLVRLGNSLTVALVTTTMAVIVSALGAFSVTRLRFAGRAVIARSILFVYLIPGSLLFIPMFIIMYSLGLTNTLLSLMITYMTFAVPFCTWMLMGYFKGIPPDMEEAAMIDGCSRVQTLSKVLIPLSAPGLVAAGIFTFTLSWNEFLYALIFITNSNLQTVPVGLAAHIVADIYMWGPLMAGSVMAALPVIALYTAAQRFVVQGMFAGAVKG